MSVKGFLKGLKYISQIFENEKEEEMQIGVPTDVKHVAHIGNDGSSSSNTPTWMNEFQGSSKNSSSGRSNGKASAKSASKGTRDIQKSSVGSPNRGKTKQSGSGSSLTIQKPRRQKNSNMESPGKKQSSKDSGGSSKSNRRKKKGGATGEGSTRSRSKVTDLHTTSEIFQK